MITKLITFKELYMQILFYKTSETNGVITERRKFLAAKGQYRYKAIIEYKYKHLHSQTIIQTLDKCDSISFARFTQQLLYEAEQEFYAELVKYRLENQLNNIEETHEDVVGTYTAYMLM